MKRIIAMLLCLSMLVSTLPASAFAAESEETFPETTAVTEAPEAATEPSEEEPEAETTEAPTEVSAEEPAEVPTEEPEEEIYEEAVEEPAVEETEAAAEAVSEELSALEQFLADIENTEDGVYVSETIVLEEDLTISIPGTLYFDLGSRLEVPEGVTLTLDCETILSGAELQVNGRLVNNGKLDIHDYLIDDTGELIQDGVFTVDGFFENYGTCRILNGAEMNVNYNSEELPGCVTTYGTFETGSGNPFGIYGQLNINGGSFEVYGYFGNLGSITISNEGWLNVWDIYTFEDGTETNGHLDILGSVYVEEGGYLNVAGGLSVGNDETGYALIEIAEGGEMWVYSEVMWCDILPTGSLVNYGTLNNQSNINLQGSFENYGTVNGTMPVDAAGRLIEQLTGDGDVVISESVTIDADMEISANSVTITNGATLTLNGNVSLSHPGGPHVELYVDGEDSVLEINGEFFAGLATYSYFTNGAWLTVNGTVTEWRGHLETGSEDSCGYVTVNNGGTMNKSYNDEWLFWPGGDLWVHEGGTLILDSNGEVDGSLDLGSGADIHGDLIIRGSVRVGSSDRGWTSHMNLAESSRVIFENGQLEVAADSSLMLDGSIQTDTEQYRGRLVNYGGIDLVGYAQFSALENYGILTANDLHIDGGDIYNEGEINVNGNVELNSSNYIYNGGQINVNADENVTGSLNLFCDTENFGGINVSSGADLTIHEGASLANFSEDGWQQDDSLNRSHLFIQGRVNVNGTLENGGYIGVGETVENPDPYAGGPTLYVGLGSNTGRLIIPEGGALDIANNGILEVDGEIENHDGANGLCNDGLFWLNGIMNNYGHFYNGGHIQVGYFDPGGDVRGELVIHEGTSLDNHGNVFMTNGGSLILDGKLYNHWNDDESHGCIHVNGNVTVNDGLYVLGDLHIPEGWETGDSGSITVAETGELCVEGGIYIYDSGSLTNNGYTEYTTEFVVEEGGSFTGNEPVALGFDNLMADFERAAEENDDARFEGTVVVPQGEHTFPELPEEKGLHAGWGAKLIVPAGAVLNIQCDAYFTNAQLIIEEGGVVNNFAHIGLHEGYEAPTVLNVAGELNNYNSLWLASDTPSTVSGRLFNSGNLHLIGGGLTVSGTLDCTGYLNVGSDLNITDTGTVNIDIAEDENGEITSVGFMDVLGEHRSGHIEVNGTLNIYGQCVLGDVEVSGGDASPARIVVNEGGVLNIEARYQDPRAAITLLVNGCISVEGGTLRQSGDSFLTVNGGWIEFDDNGVYDESAGFGYIESFPAPTFNGDIHYGSLAEELPRDRITVFGYAESIENIYTLLDEYEESGYQHGAILVEQDFTLYDDLDLPEGMALLVGHPEGESVTFEIAEGITLTTRQNVHIYENARIRNNGTFNITGAATVFSGGVLECDGEVAVVGELTFEGTASCVGKGDLAVVFLSPDEVGCINNIPEYAQILVMPYADSEEDIRDALEFCSGKDFGTVLIKLDGSVTLSQDLVIPENVCIQSNGVFTVPEDVTVTNNGDFYFTNSLVINGSWAGNAPFGAGTISGPGSFRDAAFLKQLLAEAAASGKEAWLGWNLVLDEDLELNQPLCINYTAYMEIPEGVTLTIGENGHLTVYGELAADEGGMIVNNGFFRCEVNGYAHMAEDAYSAGENGILLCDFTGGWIADLTGPAKALQTLHMENCTMEEELRTLIDWAQNKGYKDAQVYISSDITLSDSLEIPENLRVVITEWGSLILPEGITVTNNGTVENHGRLAINGTWEGNPWTGDGEVIGTAQTISQEDFLQMMEEAEDQVTLNANLVLTEDLVLDKYLIISEYGKLTVPNGITLTNVSGNIIDIFGTLHVEEGATLSNGEQCMVWTDLNGNFLMDGQYVGSTGDWTIQRQYDGEDLIANIRGFEPGDMLLCSKVRTEEQLRNLIGLTMSEGYGSGAAFIARDMYISSDLYIPENVYVELCGDLDEWDDFVSSTVVVEEYFRVTNDGTFVVCDGCTLTVNGNWAGNDPHLGEYSILDGSFYCMSQDELEAQLAEKDEVYLKKTVVLDHDMDLYGSLYLETFGNLIVPEGITLTVNGLLEVNYTGQVIVEGTLYNAGTVNVHYDGVIDISNGIYEEEEDASIKLALWGENGDRSSPAILGVPSQRLFVTVDGNDDALIREALAMGAEGYAISVDQDMELSSSLYLPDNAELYLNEATLTVPYGTQLSNDGRIVIAQDAALVVPKNVTVVNGGSVELNGRLVLNGTWKGNPWTGSGEVTVSLQILAQPESVTVAEGEKAVVSFQAEGDGLTYTWYYRNPGDENFAKTSSFTGNTYSIVMNAARNGRQVYCVVTDKYGNQVQTDTVSVNMVMNTAQILQQPVSVTVAHGETATVTVEAEGDGLTYAWYYKNPGASKFSLTDAFTANTYSISMNDARNGRQVYCVITDKYGNEVTTDTVSLNMRINKAQIVAQPVNVSVAHGETAAVSVEATGDGLTYAWYYRNAGSSKFSLTTAFDGPTYSLVMNETRDGRQVYCVITDAYGNKVQTNTVTLAMESILEILQQPVDVSVANGKTAAVTVLVQGEGLSYEWYFRNPGSSKFSKTDSFTGNSYSITMNEARDGRQVYCIITDVDGKTLQTNTVTLSMTAPVLTIVTQPTDVAVPSGKTAAVTVAAQGEGLTYKWYYRNAGGSKFSLTTAFDGPTYSVTMSATRNGRQVYCVITDKYGNEVTSDTVTLSLASDSAPVILQQPVDVEAASGERAEVTVTAEGKGLTYEWFYANAGSTKFSKTDSFTGNSYYITMSEARDGRRVYCVITDADGNTLQTNTVTLSMSMPKLTITRQPADVTVALGKTAAVTLEATGDTLTYEWYFANPGSDSFTRTASFTGNTYSVTMTEARNGRRVYCVITDADGNSVTSDIVTLRLVSNELAITRQPADVTVASGDPAEITVEATGEGLTYAWYYKNAGSSNFSVTGAFTGNTYSVIMSAARSGRQVYCVITDVDGNTVTSNTVTLNMA